MDAETEGEGRMVEAARDRVAVAIFGKAGRDGVSVRGGVGIELVY